MPRDFHNQPHVGVGFSVVLQAFIRETYFKVNATYIKDGTILASHPRARGMLVDRVC